MGLLVVMACVKTAESMEAFKARPFHLMGKTKDEVAGLKRDYERSPHGRKYQGDMGVVDAASLPLERDVHSGGHDPHHADPKKSPERSKFNSALTDFKSSFGAHEEFGSMPVLGYQKPFKDSWNEKKMSKLIHTAPKGKKGFFEAVGMLQKAGVDMAQIHTERGGKAAEASGRHPDLHAETAIDIDKIPEHKRGFFKNQAKLASHTGQEKLDRWAMLNKKAENKGWKTVRGEMTKLDRAGKPVAVPAKGGHRARRLLGGL
eukprot:jgi/Tetstr1/423760/TSEL_014390.t1